MIVSIILMFIGSILNTLALLFMYVPAFAGLVGYSLPCCVIGIMVALIGCFGLIGTKTTFKYIGGILLVFIISVISVLIAFMILGII